MFKYLVKYKYYYNCKDRLVFKEKEEIFLFDMQVKVKKRENFLFLQIFFATMSNSLLICHFFLREKKVINFNFLYVKIFFKIEGISMVNLSQLNSPGINNMVLSENKKYIYLTTVDKR